MTALAPEAFHGPYAKLERAEHHVSELETVLRTYTRENMERLRRYNEDGGRDPAGLRFGEALPKDLPVILGDAVHNFRAALDYAYCVLVKANGGTITKHTKFPFGLDRQSVEGSIKGHKKTTKVIVPSDAAIDTILDVIQPYEGGKLCLYGLHRLDIVDKHELLIPTLKAFNPGSFTFFHLNGGTTRITGSPKFAQTGNYAKPGGAAAFIRGGTIEFDEEPKQPLLVCFGLGQPFETDEIIARLKVIGGDVRHALDALARFA